MKKINIKFDSATVALDSTHKTDRIILNVTVQVQTIPVVIHAPDGDHIVSYDWNPVTKEFTPTPGAVGNNIPGLILPVIKLDSLTPDTDAFVNVDTQGFFVKLDTKLHLNADGSLSPVGGNSLSLDIIKYVEITPDIEFFGLNPQGAINTTSAKGAEALGHWLAYKDENGVWKLINSDNVPTGHNQPTALNDALTKMGTFLRTNFYENKDVNSTDEKFQDSLNNLEDSFNAFSPQIDQDGKITWFSLTADGQANLIFSGQNSYAVTAGPGTFNSNPHLIIHEQPLHSVLVLSPLDTSLIKEVISNGQQIVVSPDFTNMYDLYTISTDGGKIQTRQGDVNDTFRSYLIASTGATPGSNLANYINQLEFTVDAQTGEIKIVDPSKKLTPPGAPLQGSLGFGIAPDSKFKWSATGYFIHIVAIDDVKAYHADINLLVTNPAFPGINSLTPPTNLNFGQWKFNPVDGSWSQDPNKPPIPDSNHPSTLKFNNTTHQFELTTDGTFSPSDLLDKTGIVLIHWVVDPQNPNLWYGIQDPNDPVLPVKPLITRPNLDLNAKAIVDEIPIDVQVIVDGTKPNDIQPYGTVNIKHNRFSGVWGTFDKSNLRTSSGLPVIFKTNTGVDPLVAINPGNSNQLLKGDADPAKFSVFVDPETSFTYTTKIVNGHIVVTLTHNQSNPWPVEININGVVDEHGGNVHIQGHIIQDQITGEFKLVDEKGQPLTLNGVSFNTNVTPKVDPITGKIIGFKVSFADAKTQNSYDVQSVLQDSNSFDLKLHSNGTIPAVIAQDKNSVEVMLNDNHKVNYININVVTQLQTIPVKFFSPEGVFTVDYQWNPVLKVFTPSAFPPHPISGFVPRTFQKPNLTLNSFVENADNLVNNNTNGYFVVGGTAFHLNTDGSLSPINGGTNLGMNVIMYHEINPDIDFIGLNSTGAIDVSSGQTPTSFGHWLAYKDENGTWHIVNANNVLPGHDTPQELQNGKTLFENYLTNNFYENKDVHTQYESFEASNVNLLDSFNAFKPTIDQNGQITWFSLTVEGQQNLIFSGQHSDATRPGGNYDQTPHIVIHEQPLHSFLVQSPLDNSLKKEVQENGQQIVVSPDFTNNYDVYTIANDGGKFQVPQSSLNDLFRDYLLKSTGAAANSNLGIYIMQLEFTIDGSTGEVKIHDPSAGHPRVGANGLVPTGSLGFSIANDSRLTWSDQGYFIHIVPLDMQVYHKLINLRVELTHPHGSTSTKDSERFSFGQWDFDPTTGNWTHDSSKPVTMVQGHPNVKMEFNNTTRQFDLTTDGTFKPTDEPGKITWVQDQANPNLWHGIQDPTNLLFTSLVPQISNAQNTDFLGKNIIDKQPVDVVVVEDSAQTTPPAQYGTVELEHDRFTGEFGKFVKSDLTFNGGAVTFRTHTGIDPLASIEPGSLQNQIGDINPNILQMDTTPKTGFRYEENVVNGRIVVKLIHDDTVNANQWHPIVEIRGVVDSSNTSIPIVGRISQDSVTGKYELVDENNQPLVLAGGSLHTTITPILSNGVVTGFKITLDNGVSSNSYDFSNNNTQRLQDYNGNPIPVLNSGILVTDSSGNAAFDAQGKPLKDSNGLNVHGDSLTINF